MTDNRSAIAAGELRRRLELPEAIPDSEVLETTANTITRDSIELHMAWRPVKAALVESLPPWIRRLLVFDSE